MTRTTRSRQVASSISETNVRTASKRTTGAVTKKTIGKTRSSVRKASKQDENTMPIIQISKISKAKASKSKGSVLGTKLLSEKNELPSSTVLGMKSPALRDRTNTTNELVKADAVSKLPDKPPLDKNKKSNAKPTTRNAKKQIVSINKTSNESIEKYTVKLQKAQTEDHNKNSLSHNEGITHGKKAIVKVSEKKDINENVDKSQEQLSPDNSKSKTVLATKIAMKRKNMSMEDVEKLLYEDDDDVDVEGLQESEDEEAESVYEENTKKDEHKAKKFFKYKGIKEEEAKSVLPAKKNPVQNKKSRTAKKIKNNDSTFSPKAERQKQSSKPENKNLRTRVAKNYCETSRLSNQKEESKNDTDKLIENDHKGIPIYKTLKLSQEEKKRGPDEEYEFDELSQDDDRQKGKKRKKTVKRPVVKRAKKTTNLPFGFAPLSKKKPVKAVSKNVQFKAENVNRDNNNTVLNEKKVDNAMKTKEATITNDIETNYAVSDDLPQIGDNMFKEAPTIKIISNDKLEGTSRYHLTTTPSAPKTVTGLKVFGPKNNSSSQPNQQLTNMANHSLIRESMSPIRKVNDEFDTGSPWRAPADTFTRVRRLVQSTPQVKRNAVPVEKKPLEHVAELNKKSFSSEETIHLSSVSVANHKPNKERSLDEMSTIKQDEPRKFGTVISNMSPTKSTSTAISSNDSTTQKSPLQGTSMQSVIPANNQQSPAKAISPPSADPNLPVNYKTLDLEDPTISFDNKENISPKSSPKKKIVAPSPFRFEKIRSSHRLAAIALNSKSPKKSSPTKIYEPEPEAGPSRLDKPKATAMKQTNLNNFLNLDDMPESANISTPHGIFDDACSTPVSAKKSKKFTEEADIENAFGFDDSDSITTGENVPSVKIATEADVKNSVKGKLFPKARVKSSVPSRISENTVKRTLLKNVLKNKVVDKAPEILQEQEDSDSSERDNEVFHDQMVNYKKTEKDQKQDVLDAISFSDTFDVLSENGEELQTKVPEEIPLFVDLEPAHFSEPPRRSYNKRKRNECADVDRYFSDDEEAHEKKKAKKKKKEPHLNKEEKKRMEDWIKNVNKTFDEIEHFDLLVE